MKKKYVLLISLFLSYAVSAAPLQGVQLQHFSKVGGFSLGDSCDNVIDTLGDPTEESSTELMYEINQNDKTAKIKFLCDAMTWEVYEILVLEADPDALRMKKMRVPGWELATGMVRPNKIIRAFGNPSFISGENYSIYYKLPRNIWLNIGLSESNTKAVYFSILKDPAFLQNGEKSLRNIRELIAGVEPTISSPVDTPAPSRNEITNNRARRMPAQPVPVAPPRAAPTVRLSSGPEYLENAFDAFFNPNAPKLWKEKNKRNLKFRKAVKQEFHKYSNFIRKKLRFDSNSGKLIYDSKEIDRQDKKFFKSVEKVYGEGGFFGLDIGNFVHPGNADWIWKEINKYAPMEDNAIKKSRYQLFIKKTSRSWKKYQKHKWAIFRAGPMKQSSKSSGAKEMPVVFLVWIIAQGWGQQDPELLIDRWTVVQR